MFGVGRRRAPALPPRRRQTSIVAMHDKGVKQALTLPIADSTTIGKFSWKEHTMSATSRMRSASRTDEPPNLYTTLT